MPLVFTPQHSASSGTPWEEVLLSQMLRAAAQPFQGSGRRWANSAAPGHPRSYQRRPGLSWTYLRYTR